jgi:hypothetical protein
MVCFSSWLDAPYQITINTESSPNVEYGKMRSELDECALGVDLRGIHSAFYFYQSEARNANSASSGLNLAAELARRHRD